MLEKIGKWNDIPKDVFPALPVSEDGNPVVVKFEVLESHYDPVADQGRPIHVFASDLSIPALSRFRSDDGKWIEIGMVTSVDKDGKLDVSDTYRKLLHFNPKKNRGQLCITIGHSMETDALYQYLMLASFVEGNKIPDDRKSKAGSDGKMILRYIDEEARAKKSLDDRELKRKAVGIAATLGDDQMQEMAFILGFSKNLTDSQIKDQVWDYAEKDPEKFIARVQDDTAQYKARIAQAIALEIVIIDAEASMLRYNDTGKRELLKLANMAPESIQSEYAAFIQGTQGADKIDKALLAEIKKKSKK